MKAPPSLRWFVIVMAGGLLTNAFAGLRWETTLVERTLPVGVDLIEVPFAFSNPGAQPVTIVQAQASCDCTTPMLEKYTFAAGEKGVLTALFDGKNMTGLQEKTIRVVTDDDPNPTTLTLKITLPEWIKVSPRVLTWDINGETNAKEALVTLNPEAEIKITAMKSDTPALSVSLQPEKEKGHYRLIAKPTSTTAPLQAKVTITMEISGSAPRNYIIFAQVR